MKNKNLNVAPTKYHCRIENRRIWRKAALGNLLIPKSNKMQEETHLTSGDVRQVGRFSEILYEHKMFTSYYGGNSS